MTLQKLATDIAYHYDAKSLSNQKMTISKLINMLLAQKCECPGCGKLLVKGYTHIDHDHFSGKRHAVLCRYCNIALGNVRDNPNTLVRLATYVSQARQIDKRYSVE